MRSKQVYRNKKETIYCNYTYGNICQLNMDLDKIRCRKNGKLGKRNIESDI